MEVQTSLFRGHFILFVFLKKDSSECLCWQYRFDSLPDAGSDIFLTAYMISPAKRKDDLRKINSCNVPEA